MPVKYGLTMAQEIRSVKVNVVMSCLTAMGMKEDMIKGIDAGADEYWAKRFCMEVGWAE